MILGIGIDIIEIPRIERIISEYGGHFIERVFSDEEIEYSASKSFPAIHFAARFAAKEAFLKSLGTGLADGIKWRSISISNDRHSNPKLLIAGKAKEIAEKIGVKNIRVSISHTKEYAVAMVILEN